jgi:hypothetical protein
MDASSSSKSCVSFQQTTGHYKPEDGTLRNHHCENLKFYISQTFTQKNDMKYLTKV